ncbi:MAG: hypothetical protein M0Q19_07835 [Candidatus Cloacimonetes bacterium]|jgi:predicted DNA-binding protein|nr:hypothetical protein [Candidatus Cloacimonadota bacterium]
MSVQISAYIQDDIKEKLENYSTTHGMKKGFLIESAIEYYLQAMQELPSNIIVPNSLNISHDSYEKLEQLSKKEPNEKLKELLGS